MKTLRLLLLAGALMLGVALPAAAQDAAQAANPLQNLWNFFGINAEMVQNASAAADSGDSLQSVLAGLPQSRAEDGAFVVGDLDAPFTLVVFADWACPHCIVYETDVVEPFVREFVASGQAAFEFRPFPTAGGDTTVAAAQLAECAETFQPGAFWDSYATFFQMSNVGAYSVNTMLTTLTNRLGITQDELIACVVDWDTNHDVPMQLFTDYEFATAAGISGTPAVLVRMNGADAAVLTWNGQTYDQGGVPLDVLAEVVASVQPS
ncbi:MAG TPA: thioredoxin domain-containing protein [Candidatus Limnocylindrales bacterium]|nr:thioredoxin domain-containing protein [Candidatus Limnocylindrales bacterium]